MDKIILILLMNVLICRNTYSINVEKIMGVWELYSIAYFRDWDYVSSELCNECPALEFRPDRTGRVIHCAIEKDTFTWKEFGDSIKIKFSNGFFFGEKECSFYVDFSGEDELFLREQKGEYVVKYNYGRIQTKKKW